MIARIDEGLAFTSGCDKLIVTDDGTGGDRVARRLGVPQKKFYFWRNGVEIPPVSTREPDGLVRVISLARLDGWKRVDRIIRAFSTAAWENDSLVLDIVGGGPEFDSLVQLAYSLGVPNAIHFHGQISRSRALQLLSSSDIYISTNDYSNISNSLLEAMSAAKVIIALNTGRTFEVVSWDTGLLVDSEEELSDAILFAALPTTRLLGEGALKYSREHFESWESRINREFLLCKELIS
jgi:glycosyltransferase involved in cell wall biosynthesis